MRVAGGAGVTARGSLCHTANGLGCLSVAQRRRTICSDWFQLIVLTFPSPSLWTAKGKQGTGEVGSKHYWQIGLCSHFELWSTQLGVRTYRFRDHTTLIFTNSNGCTCCVVHANEPAFFANHAKRCYTFTSTHPKEKQTMWVSECRAAAPCERTYLRSPRARELLPTWVGCHDGGKDIVLWYVLLCPLP